MRLVRFRQENALRLGIEEGGVVDLEAALVAAGALDEEARRTIGDTIAFIEAGERGRALAETALEEARRSGAGRREARELALASPLDPAMILCSGENYWDHREEKPPVEGKEPEFFIKVPQGVIGPEDAIVRDPRVTKKLDYEVELAIVIGRPGRHIPAEQGLAHVYGYTVMNDVTARDRQVRMRADGTCSYAVGPGKNFDTCAPMGPAIVTADGIPDPQTLALKTWVNDELRQSNTTAKMIWGVAELVAFFSTFLTLQPGFVISTGTPGGTAWASDPELGGRPYARGDVVRAAGYLRPGDRVCCEIERIGRLCNPVIAASGA